MSPAQKSTVAAMAIGVGIFQGLDGQRAKLQLPLYGVLVNSKGPFPHDLNQHFHLLWGEVWPGGVIVEKSGNLPGYANVGLALHQVQEQIVRRWFFPRA